MDRKFPTYGTPAGTADQAFWLRRASDGAAPRRPAPRHSLRRPLNMEALVNHGLTYSSPWPVRDLSLTGAFVEMDAGQLSDGTYVEFVLRYRYLGKLIEHRIPASVARVQADGVALIFGEFDDQTYTDLANLLYAL